MTNLLITGMSGLIGSACRAEFETDFTLTALNRRAVTGIPTVQGSLENYGTIRPAFENQDIVVHLAAKVSDDYGWEALHQTNVRGTRNVLEAARDAGVKRVVFASSGATVAGWEREEPYRSIVEGDYTNVPSNWRLIDEAMATRARNLYAATKVWGEALGRHYADNHGLEVVCLRIGFANAEDRPLNPRQFSVWNSRRDAVQAIRKAMAVSLPQRCEILFILSENRWSYRDIRRARDLLDYVPEDRAEDHRS